MLIMINAILYERTVVLCASVEMFKSRSVYRVRK